MEHLESVILRLQGLSSQHAQILKKSLGTPARNGGILVKNKTVLDAELFIIEQLEKPEVQRGLQRGLEAQRKILGFVNQPSIGSKLGIANPGPHLVNGPERMGTSTVGTRNYHQQVKSHSARDS